ncbi:hypothetical protein GF342_04870 [Candidatus Woesearchaeota archaeon]|nr:hypothetical protein [Candidatus Woesearchaeota archaeon]
MKKLLGLVLALGLLAGLATADTVSTTTQVQFNVDTVVGFTLTLPSETAVSASSGGAATTSIEFVSTTGDDQNVNAKVSGGATQASGSPIFQYDNTGTVDLDITVSLDSDLPSCMTLRGDTTYSGADTGDEITSSSDTEVVADFAPSAGAQDWYMKTDFTGCTASDGVTRTLTSQGSS